jgi:hypothetical protein
MIERLRKIRFRLLPIGVFFAIALMILVACATTQTDTEGAKSQATNGEVSGASPALAIIRTSGAQDSSYIEYYRKDLTFIDRRFLPYSNIGQTWEIPAVFDGYYYGVPQGLDGRHDNRFIFSLDLKSGEAEEYAVNQMGLQYITATDDYIFVTDNLNGISHITRCDKDSKEIKELTFEEDIISSIIAVDDVIYAYSMRFADKNIDITSADYKNSYFIYQIDESLEIQQKFDITDYGYIGESLTKVGNMLYWNNVHTDEEEEFLESVILGLDTETGEIEVLFRDSQPVVNITFANDTLYIFHHEYSLGESSVTIFDLNSRLEIDTVPVPHEPTQTLVDENMLYMVGRNFETGEWTMLSFNIADGKFVESGSVSLDQTGFSYPSYHYATDFFFVDEVPPAQE